MKGKALACPRWPCAERSSPRVRTNTIKLWDLRSRACQRALNEHTGYVRGLATNDDVLISGSSDSTIKVWCRQTWACLRTLTGHTNSVSRFALHDGKLFSASWDKSIKIWDTTTWACVRTLDYDNAVFTVLVRGDKVVAGLRNGTIVVKKTDTGETLSTLKGHTGMTQALLILNDGRLVSGSHDSTLKVWA